MAYGAQGLPLSKTLCHSVGVLGMPLCPVCHGTPPPPTPRQQTHPHTHTQSPEKGRLCCPGWASWLLLWSVAHQEGTRGLKTKFVSENTKLSSAVGQQASSLELLQKAQHRLSGSQPARLSCHFLLLLLFLAPFTCRYFSPLETRPRGDCCPIPWTCACNRETQKWALKAQLQRGPHLS